MNSSTHCTVDWPEELMEELGDELALKGAFTPETRAFTRSTMCRVTTGSVAKLREGRGLSPCLVSVKTVIISFCHGAIRVDPKARLRQE